MAGNGWGEEAAGDQRAWLRGRLRTGNGCEELCGRLRTAWVPGSGWKWVGEKEPLEISELGCAEGCRREMGAENCADGCGRRGCKGVAENGCWRSASLAARTAADGKWVRRVARTAADGVVQLREWLEMGGEKKPLVMSELRCADGCGREVDRRIAQTAADSVGAREGLEMGGRRSRW